MTWSIDKAKHIVRLEAADIVPALELPLAPMLGCIAVAPDRREAFLSTTPGPFGGNMDYAGLTAGATVMLQVNEQGALLFVGDGHARQGAGEVVGQGLETSLDVEFTVDLVKHKTIGWPRIETESEIMVLGSARPLIEALQHDVANVVDPAFTIVAKVRKALLPRR